MNIVRKAFQDHLDLAQACLAAGEKEVKQAGELLVSAYRRGNKVLLFGNGGSASDALHLEGELLGRFRRDRKGLPAIALGGGLSALTAVANDYGYETAFARLAEAHIKPEDVVLLFSTSGRSPNILGAAKASAKQGAVLIGLTGATGGALKDHVNLLIEIPSTDTARIQEMHILVGHILCQIVEERLFGDDQGM